MSMLPWRPGLYRSNNQSLMPFLVRSSRGVTLIELIVLLIVMGIVSAGIARVLSSGFGGSYSGGSADERRVAAQLLETCAEALRGARERVLRVATPLIVPPACQDTIVSPYAVSFSRVDYDCLSQNAACPAALCPIGSLGCSKIDLTVSVTTNSVSRNLASTTLMFIF